MVTISDSAHSEHWDSYVQNNDSSNFSHLSGWAESLAKTYNLKVFQLAAIESETNRICGILPLIMFDPPEGISRLISLPYTDCTGIVADNLETGKQLLKGALQLTEELGAHHLELRQDKNLDALFAKKVAIPERWNSSPHTFKTGLCRQLPPNVDQLWSAISSKVRNQVRKARRCDCLYQTGKTELLSDFYAVFSENMRDLGSPVHSPELFVNILENESLRATVLVVYRHDQPVAGALVFCHNRTLYNPWASSLRSSRKYCPNMLLYWAMLEYGVQQDCRRFDFGRSTPNAPTCLFKMQWGAEPQPLCWHVFSQPDHLWNPRMESLEHDEWKGMTLDMTRRDGPGRRRWISL